jgi:hypothetical protein
MDERKRQQMVAVSDDHNRDNWIGLQEGDWASFVTAGPIYYGQIVAITPTDYILREASWLPDTGRLSEFMKTQIPNEAEYVGEVEVPRGALMGKYRHRRGGRIETK